MGDATPTEIELLNERWTEMYAARRRDGDMVKARSEVEMARETLDRQFGENATATIEALVRAILAETGPTTARDEMPAPGENIPALIERLARWHRRLLAARSNNSSIFLPHRRDDGYLSDDVLAAMIALEAAEASKIELASLREKHPEPEG